ncbi:NRDE-2, necessary for RNA interference-domain-containing protein [Boletus reticuloceps]|uniref:NRDE-2, necessary for RNA interference-domain-containing protein n=1 Tax=Boletus reticuloceps TaxID=495285 RepID=A0A8I3AD82_9AGAM|nr:NRDE-2, necessary for RNA interference-domain-containing protein [Boletus reticuloceps]
MSASSFPPSFSSFPDIDPGPSNRTPSPARNDNHRDHSVDFLRRDKSVKRIHREKDRHSSKREKHLSLADNWRGSEPRAIDSLLDDERLKANEDRLRFEQHGQEHDRWVPRPLFYSDRKGDSHNLTYGRLHTSDVPKYRPVAHGKHILGLDKAWTVSHRGGEGIQVTIGQRKQPSLTHPSSSALLAAPSRRLVASTDNYKYKEVDGFLRLTSRTNQNIDQVFRPLSRGEASSESELSAFDAEGESSDDDHAPTLTSHQLTIKALEGRLTADPSSVQTWLSLVAQSLSVVPLTSKNAVKARSEVTLSVLSRARGAHPSNLRSPTLSLKYLRAGEELWDQTKLTAEWEDALKSGGIGIWMEWLEWRIRASVGGIDQVVWDATRALKALGSSEDSELDRLRVVWRVAVAFQEAGFHERATALFQAQAELTFEVPQSLYGLPVDTQLDSLEEFWESEVPRVGEPNAKGWSGWVSSGKPKATLSSLETTSMDIDSTSADPFIRWYNDETRADMVSRIPARYESGVSDPYATVLLSDIKALLLPLTTQKAKNAFRLVWLSIMGLHIPGFADTLANEAWDDRWSYTHLATVSRLSSIFPHPGKTRQLLADSHAGVLIGKEREYGSVFGPVKDWSLDVLGPLDWVGKDHWRMWTAKDIQGVQEDFVRAIFSQLRCGAEDYQWDVYGLAFEASVNVKSALKLSRTLLSHAPESLPHWAAHGRLERLRGRIEDARKVYQTVLISTRHSPTQAFIGQMWWDWAELEWMSGDQDVALRVVMRSGNVDGTGGMMILRAKRNLEDIINAAQGLWKDREGWMKLRALIDLLTGSSLPGMLAMFDSQSTGVGKAVGESFMVASLVMLYNHAIIRRTPTPPAILRERLQAAIGKYPNNMIVLGMFLEAEKGYGVWGRVRGQLGEGVADGGAKEKGVSRRAAEVWVAGWERGRWEVEAERTRNGLVGAVESDRTRNSAIVWRIVVEFEIRTGQLQRAKNLLYRAVGECPFSKGLYLLAFGPLRQVFTARELAGFVDIMAERGLRIRRGLEEYGWKGEEEMKGKDKDEEDEDEIEWAASERRRLMPY